LHGTFLDINGTFWLQIVNFAIFYAILYVTFIKPVGSALAARRAHIDEVARDRSTSAGRAAHLRAEAEQLRLAARREAAETLARERSAAQSEADRIAATAAGRAQGLVSEAHSVVQSELRVARESEDRLARDLARTLLARAVSGAAS